MDKGTGNPEPSWQQSARTRASAAAEHGNGPSNLEENTRVSHADRYNVYGSIVTPGIFISADLRATSSVNNHASTFVHPSSLLANENGSTADAIYVDGTKYPTTPTPTNWGVEAARGHQNNDAFAPLANSSPAPFAESTFATGEGYTCDDALLTAPIRPNWGAAGATAHSDNHAFAPLSNPIYSRLTGSSFAAGARSEVAATPSTAIPYTWGPAATTAHSSNYNFAPFIASNPSHLIENTFATGAAYNGGNANPGALWRPAASTDFTDSFNDSGLQYADPTRPMMNSFAADANGTGNDYQGRIATPSFNSPFEETVDLQKTPYATRDNGLDLATQRPTCAKCSKSFTRKADLDRHAKKHQADAKIFRCGVVGCTFDNYRKDKVLVHIRRRHGGVGAVLTLG